MTYAFQPVLIGKILNLIGELLIPLGRLFKEIEIDSVTLEALKFSHDLDSYKPFCACY